MAHHQQLHVRQLCALHKAALHRRVHIAHYERVEFAHARQRYDAALILVPGLYGFEQAEPQRAEFHVQVAPADIFHARPVPGGALEYALEQPVLIVRAVGQIQGADVYAREQALHAVGVVRVQVREHQRIYASASLAQKVF